MIEVEIKLPEKNPVKLRELLCNNGFLKGKMVREEDTYFNSAFKDLRKTDEAFRIRKVINLQTQETNVFMTYKGPKLDQVSMTRKEVETRISNAEEMQEILAGIGYELRYPVIKTREYYTKNKITVCVDAVEGLGDFLEIEVLEPDERNRDQALKQIWEVLIELGHSMEETTRTSYLTMLMER